MTLPDTPNGRLVTYLMSSYLYYVEDVHVLSDCDFDHLCSRLVQEWEQIEHRHRELVSLEDLRAGTGYALKYPKIVVASARRWYRESTAR